MTDNETFETIRYTADVVAVTPDGHVLLIKRDWPPYQGAWALPGGHVDPGETSRAAAARELAEETGVPVMPADLRQVGTFDAPGRDPRGRYVTVAYLTTVPANTPIVAGDDARTARWWPLTNLPPLAFDHADILRAVTTPIRNRCQGCGKKWSDVEVMPDPFASALYPEEEHEVMSLCPPCALDRFEDS